MALTANNSTNSTGDPSASAVNLICTIGPIRWGLVSILVLMMIFSMFGNVVLITSIWRTPKLRTRTNCFILNLACADLGVSLFCMPFSLVTCYLQRWIFGDVMCQINGFMNTLFGATSLLTLSAVSLEKYFSIVRAMNHVITKRRTIYMLVCTWIVPAVLAVMPLTGFTSYRLNPGSTQCSTETPLRRPGQIIHAVFMLLFTFFAPLCIIGVSYVSIFGAARKHSQRMSRRSVVSNSSESLNFLISTQSQISLTVFIMIIVFLICWCPFFVYLIYLATNEIRVLDESTRNLVLAAYWLAFLNSVVNPYIYGVRNPQVRDAVRGLLSSLVTRSYDVHGKTSLKRVQRSRKVATCHSPFPVVNEAPPVDCGTGLDADSSTGQVLNLGYINMLALDEEDSKISLSTLGEMEERKQHQGNETTTEIKPFNCIGQNAEVDHSNCQSNIEGVAHRYRDDQSKDAEKS